VPLQIAHPLGELPVALADQAEVREAHHVSPPSQSGASPPYVAGAPRGASGPSPVIALPSASRKKPSTIGSARSTPTLPRGEPERGKQGSRYHEVTGQTPAPGASVFRPPRFRVVA